MIKEFCDRCGFEITQGFERHDVEHGLPVSSLGKKVICKSCWEKWTEAVMRFFAKQGQ